MSTDQPHEAEEAVSARVPEVQAESEQATAGLHQKSSHRGSPRSSSRATAKPLADRRCRATTLAGSGCPVRPLANGEYCRMHAAQRDPQLREIVQAERRLGGHAATRRNLPANVEAADYSRPETVRRMLEQTTDAVIRGDIAPSIANSVAALGNVALRLAELSLSSKLAELEARTAKLRPGLVIVSDDREEDA